MLSNRSANSGWVGYGKSTKAASQEVFPSSWQKIRAFTLHLEACFCFIPETSERLMDNKQRGFRYLSEIVYVIAHSEFIITSAA